MLDMPLRWKRPQSIFVNSMSDLFHRDIPVDYILRVFSVMRRAHWHRFQILTKRSDRLVELDPLLDWAPNIWMGVSVESDKYRARINDLRETGAQLKFLSLEPLLGPLPNLDLGGIDWVIVGGESGLRAREIDPAWVIDLRSQCQRSRVPFFFKQWGQEQKESGQVTGWQNLGRDAGWPVHCLLSKRFIRRRNDSYPS